MNLWDSIKDVEYLDYLNVLSASQEWLCYMELTVLYVFVCMKYGLFKGNP
jgi:hypothetical protein